MSYVPIKDAKVTIRNESLVKIAEGYTDENGIIKFNLPKGRYNISVEKEGYQKHEQWIDLLDSLTKEVVLEKAILQVTIETFTKTRLKDSGEVKVIPIGEIETRTKTLLADWHNIYTEQAT